MDSVTKLGKDMNQISFSPTSELVRSTHSVIQKRWEKVVDVMSALQAADELYSDDWDSVLDAYHILHQALTETGYLLDNIQSLADATDAYQQDSLHAQHQLKDLTDTIQKLNQGAQLLMVEASDDIGSMLADNRFISVGMSVLVFSLLVVVGYGLLRSIKRPLMAFKAFVEQVEEGDLTRVLHLNSGDEFEEASVKLNCLTKRLNLVMSKIGFQANDVISTTDYVMQSSEALSDVLNQQIQAVSEINQIMQTLNTSGARVRDNVEQTHQRIDEVSQLTTQAVQEARDSSCTMNELKQLLTQTRGHVEQLVIDIRDIHGMTNLIGDVAKQTNLLALNAAIEAARASSHGSGFAVVAEKVRELANSANETTNLIRNRIEQIVIQSTDSKESVERCYAIVEKVYERFIVTDGIMNNIDKATNEVSTFTSEVSETAEAQFQHIKSTGVSLDSIAALAHSNVETFKGIRSTMMGLGQVSSSLKKEVEYFKYQDG
ncbi:MAG: methyl-accepting chemotaxis protein [Gammaproteobacteria bacterium]